MTEFMAFPVASVMNALSYFFIVALLLQIRLRLELDRAYTRDVEPRPRRQSAEAHCSHKALLRSRAYRATAVITTVELYSGQTRAPAHSANI